ncbi:hypothetical protein GCM10010503_37580 [Streptomyces lucensis JCM 4490]|uniref:Uncharacterized protein n=1 Tax=Streptomyces lucensis JCM 4490 TaxID=1306176 RepID=A0A918MSF9_9ACTN|nr:hypothetical protein GCM10010503_37580 [Streptomyces lucensis JCM 4490]
MQETRHRGTLLRQQRRARPGEAGFDAAEWKTRVGAAGGDVAQAVRDWMVDTGRLEPGAALTHLEVRELDPGLTSQTGSPVRAVRHFDDVPPVSPRTRPAWQLRHEIGNASR